MANRPDIINNYTNYEGYSNTRFYQAGQLGNIMSFTLHQDAVEVPEPSTLMLATVGVFGMLARRRRK